MAYIIFIIGILWLAWFIYKNQERAVTTEINTTGIRIKQSHPYGNDYVKLEVIYSGRYIRFDIAGINYRKGISKCMGEFEGTLVPEPSNPHDPHAVKVIHSNGTHVGYVPRNYDGDRARYDVKLPCACHGIILRGDTGYYGICVVPE